MRIGVVMDATCDLPQDWIEKHHVTVLPIVVKIDDQSFSDERDSAETQRFLDEKLGNRSHSAETDSYSTGPSRSCSWNVWWSITTACSA